jgi:hypothetical protein
MKTTPEKDNAAKKVIVKVGGVSGDITGVNKDIIDYVRAVGVYYGANIVVTSGYRDPERQAQAMFGNWLKLNRGEVYKEDHLPVETRKKMNDAYKIAEESPKATDSEKAEAKNKFIELGKTIPGYHTQGRAIDISRGSLPENAKQALDKELKQVQENDNISIWHYQKEDGAVSTVTEDTKSKWPKP